MMTNHSRPFSILASVLLVAGGLSAQAGDGQIDILPSPSMGFTINKSGSYVLVDNVTMTADVTCIKITVDDVTLDLNGHTITGTGAGTDANGINGNFIDRIRVLNGTVRNFGGDGIRLGSGAHVEDVAVDSNSGDGVQLENEGIVQNVIARLNGEWGILCSSRSFVENCVASGNNENGNAGGISVFGGEGRVINCSSSSNSGSTGSSTGIYLSSTGTAIGNQCNGHSAFDNGADAIGILVSGDSVIANNVCSENTAFSQGGSGIGIKASGRPVVEGNTCSGNDGQNSGTSGIGISVDSSANVFRNTCSANRGSPGGLGVGILITGDGNKIEDNLCAFNQGGSTPRGILVLPSGSDNVVIANTTIDNGTQGIEISPNDFRSGNVYNEANISGGSGGTVPGGDTPF